jgi:hypothetical protein
MELIQTVLLVAVILILLYIILNWFFAKSTQLTTMRDATEKQKIIASTLPNNSNTSNYTYSTWFYLSDWNYRFGEEKVLLGRLDEDQNPSPSITFDAMENNITIAVSCYPQNSASGMIGNKSVVHKCNITNFPLQKWVNLIISLYGRTLDVYLDGKLVRTCVLPGVAKVNPAANILVTPNGGFNGFTSNFQYWPTATNPQQAYNIYKDGFGGSVFGNLFNKFRLKVSLLEDNREKGSFEI